MELMIAFHLARGLRQLEGHLRGLEESQAELTAALQEADEVARALRSQIDESKRLLAEFSRFTALN